MLEPLKTLFILLFFGLNVAIVIYSQGGNWDAISDFQKEEDSKAFQDNKESYFTNARYYIYRDSRNFFHLNSSELAFNNETRETFFVLPQGEAYNDQGLPIFYQAKRGHYDAEKGILYLVDEVDLKFKETQLQSQKAHYKIQKDEMVASGDVKTKSHFQDNGDRVFVNALKVTSWPKKEESVYEGQVRGKVLRKRVYEDNIEFGSNKMYLFKPELRIELLGNVSLKKWALTADSQRGEIFLENYNKKLKYYVLYDDVKVKELVMLEGPSGNRQFTRRAYGEKLEGIMSEDKIILTGYPRVYQETDVIKGNRIILRQNNEVVEVDNANTNFIIK